MTDNKKYRLITRSDFDGLACAVILRELGMIDKIKFVQPKDMQDGKMAVTDQDISANLPYVEGVHLAFDHHLSETLRVEGGRSYMIIDPHMPSAARVIFNYYGGRAALSGVDPDMLEAVDKADTAQFTENDILNPTDWVLLSFIMDPRTGLGRFKNFRISNYDLMMDLITHCKHLTIDEILELPDVRERLEIMKKYDTAFTDQLKRCATVKDNLVVLDLRNEAVIYPGNRFRIYTMFPECNISIHVIWGRNKRNTVFAVGKSIVNISSNTNVGQLMLEYGGGGHENAGTCQIENDRAETVLEALSVRINADG